MSEKEKKQDPKDKPIDYKARQAVEDQEYKSAFDEWMAELSPKEREQLKEQGITGAHLDSQGVGGPELDTDRLISEIPLEETEEPVDYDDPRVMAKATEMVRAVVGELLTASNKSLTVECFALVTGIAYTGASQTEIAKRHGVTRAAVSKRCVELTDRLGLNPSRAMKSKEARESCSVAQYEAHSEWAEHENWEDENEGGDNAPALS